MTRNTSSDLNQTQSLFPFHSKAGKITAVVGLSTVMLFSIIGNILIIVIFRSFRHVRKQVTNHFLINLAISDLIVTLVTMPFWLLWEIDRWKSLPMSWDRDIFNKIWSFIDITCEATSIANLAVVSMDRLYSVTNPFKHHTKVTPSHAHKVIIGSWTYAAMTASLFLMKSKLKIALIAVLAFFVPLTVMIVCYTKIVIAVRACRRRWSSNPSGNKQLFGRIVNEYKTAKNLGIVMFVFGLCWLPFFVSSMIIHYCRECIASPTSYHIVIPSIVKWLHYSNSAINPILYTCFNPSFRVVFRRYHAWLVHGKSYRCTRYEAWFMTSRRTSLNSQQPATRSTSPFIVANGNRNSSKKVSNSSILSGLQLDNFSGSPGNGVGTLEMNRETPIEDVFLVGTINEGAEVPEDDGIETLHEINVLVNGVGRRLSSKTSDTVV